MIRVLSEDVVNQIAAGEVVERPAHLAKELIENSLDAGATSISIDVAEGGRELQIEDNGCGIAPDELSLALDRFATSKILNSSDLWSLKSFGFRGEALASIASVSKLSLISRVADQNLAARIDCEFGQKSKIDRVAANPGTCVRISDLFENIPARLKFLKSPAAEVGALRQMVKAMSLANPQVEFRFRINSGLDLYLPPAQSFLARAQKILETPELMLAQYSEAGVQILAAMAPADITMKVNRGMWLFVQNRWVQDRTLQAAVMESYRNNLMHGEYPLVVLKLTLNPQEVDVNVHPAKSQVKFLNSSQIFRAVNSALRPHLESFKSADRFQAPTATTMSFQDFAVEATQYKTRSENFANGPTQIHPLNPDSNRFQGLDQITEQADNYAKVAEIKKGPWSQLQVLGQSHLTYILAQSREHLVLIDQHAAHERILFESFRMGFASGKLESQRLLFPLVIDMSPEKVDSLLETSIEFLKYAIELERMGPGSVGVISVPSLAKETAVLTILEKVATEKLENGGSFSLEKAMMDVAASLACHSAIRAGQAMAKEEMENLLLQMDQFSFSSFCPHGRPVSVSWGLGEIEKEFGRRN